MNLRPNLILAGIAAGSLVALTMLAVFAEWSNPLKREVSRNIIPDFLRGNLNIDLPPGQHYLAGTQGEKVVIAPRELNYALVLDPASGSIDSLHTDGAFRFSRGFQTPRLTVGADGSLVFDRAGKSFCLTGPNQEPVNFRSNGQVVIQQAEPLAGSSFVFQTVVEDGVSGEHLNMIGRWSVNEPGVVYAPSLLNGDTRGYHTGMGTLTYCTVLNLCVYVFKYSGEFCVFDPAFASSRRFPTIDSLGKSPIRTLTISADEYALASPDWVVNHKARVWDRYLMIQSGVDSKYAGAAPLIDAYALPSGDYRGSFIIPAIDQAGLTDFILTDSYLVALSGETLLVYSLPAAKEILISSLSSHCRAREDSGK